jgi:3-deoxy-D-manno-octulosonic-acid transferase
MAGDMAAAGASETVSDGEALARAISALLADRRLRAERAAAGRRVAAAGLGILDAVLVRLAPWLDPLAPMEGIADRPQCLHA